MKNKVYQGTIDSLLQNDAFVLEFLQAVRRNDLSRLIEEGIFAKLFIADASQLRHYGTSFITGNNEFKAP